LENINPIIKKPILICLTPVRNEDWCLNLFLTRTSTWADYIIIADQNSTDKSRIISMNFPKVILVDNFSDPYDESERQKILINKAREIKGDKIIFAFDADEVFPIGFEDTVDWKNILSSNPGDVFGFRWANITSDKKSYFESTFFYPWAFHDDGITPHGRYVKQMHSMRIPFPEHAENGWYHVKQFNVIHLAHIFSSRVYSKWRFYQCLEVFNNFKNNPISSFRSYNYQIEKFIPLKDNWITFKDGSSFYDMLNLNVNVFWFDFEVVRMLNAKGFKLFSNLSIWDDQWITSMDELGFKIKDPRNCLQKMLHFYLRSTQPFFPNYFIKFFDFFFKKYFFIKRV